MEYFGVPLLMEACPSFANQWEAEVRDANLDEEVEGGRLIYGDAGDFIRHVVSLKPAGHTTEFPAVFGTIERLLREGDSSCRNSLSPDTSKAFRWRPSPPLDQIPSGTFVRIFAQV